MTKQERLELIRTKFNAKKEEENSQYGEIPVSKREVDETMRELDSFQEFERNQQHQRTCLTSDAN